ncbi:MAG: alpha-galactosidase [Bacteroidales bacterium]|nr:alpha-galactosidase [Bacteroidales bacterium]
MFKLQFYSNNKLREISFFDNYEENDVKISVINNSSHIKLELSTNQKVILKSLVAETDFKLSENDKIFVNGYQSWTDSQEFSANEKMKRLPFFAKITNKFFKFKQYGDYTFFKQKLKKGDFYGFAYAYIRNEENYKFFASNNENFAHTIILFSVKEQKIRFIVDCENIEMTNTATLLDITQLKGSKSIINEYFKSISDNKKATPKIGWTSWYNYYQKINEKIILSNLEQFKNYFPKGSQFQIDDGFQTAVGDWLSIDKYKFPNGLSPIVEKIHSLGYEAGLWLAPFSAQKNSKLAKDHPDWILKDNNGKKVFGGINWGGFYALDFYNKDVKNYLKNVFDTILNYWNFDLIKLDFLYSVAIIPQHGKSRAKVMSEAMDFLREIVGEKKILGCGVPIAQAFNNVDYCRIGCDISLDWNGKFYEKWLHRERVSTYNSLKNTIFRHFLDDNVFLNDPDVFLLRNDNIKLTKNQKITLFLINSIFGSLVFTSDDFSKYEEWQKLLLKNLEYFHKAKVLSVEENNDLVKFSFKIENKTYLAFSNLSKKTMQINCVNLQLLDIFTFEKKQDNFQNSLQPFETKLYEG